MKFEKRIDFYSSEKVARSFEINQRIVYSVRSLGQGYISREKINALMNFPLPTTINSYETLANKIASMI